MMERNDEMRVTILENGKLQVDNCRIRFKNFEGRQTDYNRLGDRNFALVIPNMEIAEALMNDKNEYGVGWNVNIKEVEDGDPHISLKVKVKFNEWGPKIFVRTGNARIRLTEENVKELDRMSISHIDMDIRPYDGSTRQNGPFRAAYLDAMEVVQNVDRFTARYMEEQGEPPFEED